VPFNHSMAPSETVSTSKSYYFCIKGHGGHGADNGADNGALPYGTSDIDRVRDYLITSVSTLPIYILSVLLLY